MRTIFAMGIGHNPFFMGIGEPPLSTADAEKLYHGLDQASDKLTIVNEWKKNHPDLQRDLGTDFDNWQLLMEDETKYGSAAEGLKKQLEKEAIVDRQAEISVDPDNLRAANYWIAAVERLYVITANHTGVTRPEDKVRTRTTEEIKTATSKIPSQTATQQAKSMPGAAASPASSSFPIVPVAVGAGALAILGVILFAGRS